MISEDMDGCIAHPEHMKRDNVISLSTSLGDTYYLQTTSQAEVDSWIRTIHSGTYYCFISNSIRTTYIIIQHISVCQFTLNCLIFVDSCCNKPYKASDKRRINAHFKGTHMHKFCVIYVSNFLEKASTN